MYTGTPFLVKSLPDRSGDLTIAPYTMQSDNHLPWLWSLIHLDTVSMIDLTPTLQEEAQRRNDVYGKINVHLDDYGHFLVARELHRMLVELGLAEKAVGLSPPSSSDMNVGQCP